MLEITKELYGTFNTTQDIPIPDTIIDSVIGQDHAVEVIKIAAQHRRNVLLIGAPGTGKSLLGRAYAELLPKEPRPDVLVYPNFDNPNSPNIVLVEQGLGKYIVKEFQRIATGESLKAKIRQHLPVFTILIIYAIYLFFIKSFDFSVFLFTVLVIISYEMLTSFRRKSPKTEIIPNLIISTDDPSDGDSDSQDILTKYFIDATGAEIGRLLGDVKHDPYETGGLGTPPHERVMPGAIHLANKGVLFIDEIGTLSYDEQISLLTAMQERKFPITGRSVGSTAATIQTEPVPCDFALVAAGNYETLDHLHPAFRSRFSGYGYEIIMNEYMPDTFENRAKIIRFIAQEVNKWNLLPFTRAACYEVITIAKMLSPKQNTLTLSLRKLGGYVRIASDIASKENQNVVTELHVRKAIALLSPIETQRTVKEIFDKYYQGYGSIAVTALTTAEVTMGIISVSILDTGRHDIQIIGSSESAEQLLEHVQRAKHVMHHLFPDLQIVNKQIIIEIIGKISPYDEDLALPILLALISYHLHIQIPKEITAAGSIDLNGNIFPANYIGMRINLCEKANVRRLIANVNRETIEFYSKSKTQLVCITNATELVAMLQQGGLS